MSAPPHNGSGAQGNHYPPPQSYPGIHPNVQYNQMAQGHIPYQYQPQMYTQQQYLQYYSQYPAAYHHHQQQQYYAQQQQQQPPQPQVAAPGNQNPSAEVQRGGAVNEKGRKSQGNKRGGKGKGKGRERKQNKNKRSRGNDDLYVPEKYRIAAQIGNTPEEIAKWREDRKKNFPTRANIEKKNREQQAVGENEKEPSVNTSGKEESIEATNVGIRDTDSNQKQASSEQIDSGVGLLFSGYASSSSDDEDDKCIEKSEKPSPLEAFAATKPELNEGKRGKKRKAKGLCRHFASGRCAKGDKCFFSHDTQEAMKAKANKRNASILRSQKLTVGKQRNGKDSLLRKLLEKDIRKEHNVFLQCVRYVIESNFLQDEVNN